MTTNKAILAKLEEMAEKPIYVREEETIAALQIALEALQSIRSGDRSDAVNRKCDEAFEDIAEKLGVCKP